MKGKIGFVSIGQAGGNIGDLLAEKGYNVLAINTSKEDLATLKFITHKYHVPNGLGCSKNRDTAKQAIASYFDSIVDQIDNFCKEDIIYFIFSAGGGTGSGLSPWLIDILISDGLESEGDTPTKNYGVITILPSDQESPRARENAYACFSELAAIEGLCNVFVLDNNKLQNPKTLNRIFVDLLDSTLEIPKKHKSSNGNVDLAEICKMFTTPGASVISITSGKTDDAKIVEKLRDGIFASIDSSSDNRFLSYLMSSTISPLDYKLFISEFGQYLDEYHTFNQNTNIVMLNGLGFPKERLDSMLQKVKTDAAQIKSGREHKKASMTLDTMTSSLDDIEDTPVRKRPITQDTSSETSKNVVKSSRRDELLKRLQKR